MSGPFGSQQWMYDAGFYPHKIGNSVRFDSNSQFTRTPSSSGDMRTFTFSAWVKRSKLSDSNFDGIFSAGTGGSNRDVLYFDANDKLEYNGYAPSSYYWRYTSTQSFRDPSAWYHIVISQDTEQATDSNRIKIYVNGEQITAFSNTQHPNQNQEGYINHTSEHTIGSTPYDTTYFDGYIAEVNFIDGQQLDPSYFGETKADTWIPKKYTGSYGSNGYYLDFATRATDPIDASGNGNNWGSVNVVSTDWMLDSPTNNFSTYNPAASAVTMGTGTYSEGALQFQTPTVGGGNGQCTIGVPSSGKWYWEAYVKASDSNVAVAAGFCNSDVNDQYPTASTTAVWYLSYGGGSYLTVDGSNESYDGSSGVAVGDIIGVSYDGTNVKFYKNNTLIWTKAYDVTGLVPFITDGTGGSPGSTVLVNFGQDSSFAGNKTAQGNTDANGRGDFYYSPPSGHLALCTANLSDPVAAINPAVNNSPQDNFNTALYTGDGSSSGDTKNVDVGVDLDFVWIKNRSSGSTNHTIFDRLRGDVGLNTNNTGAEYSFGDFNMNSNNTIDAPYSSSSSYSLNTNNETYVAWALKAGGSGSSNSDGTISATVSANTDAGFSIATYNGSSAGTVGHGLSSTPELVIQKTRDTTGDYWWTGTTVIDGSLDFLKLNATDAKADSSYTAPTSSVFSNVTFSGATSNVAYCFHSVEGFSKIGSYTGNGNADGPFVYTGFRPAFVIVKNANAVDSWFINDNKRNSFNVVDSQLFANSSDAEADSRGLDFLSNGFKIRDNSTSHNGNGNTILYMAFAEMPFKYANAR